MAEVYDIFISYRREGGFETAQLLNDRLVKDGYTVSFDLKTLREGDFDKALLERVEQCSDFLLVVDKNCFQKTLEGNLPREKDWLRVELAYALELKKNIIPIRLKDAVFPDNLPDDIKDVPRKNDPGYSKNHFDAFYEKLKSFLHSHPRVTVNGESNNVQQHDLKIRCDIPCSVYIDGELIGDTFAGEILRIPLEEGQYFLKCKSRAYPGIAIDEDIDMPNKTMVRKFFLQQSLQKEREARGKFMVGGVEFQMIYVEGGTFTMGSTPEQGDDAHETEKPAHKVTVDDYYIGETVVTQALWKAVMGDNPSDIKGDDNCPVECVSWNDVTQKFIPKLNCLTGRSFRLPTEAEWEFAARGGNKSKGYKYSGSDDINEVAWYWKNSGDRILKGTDYDRDWKKIRNNNNKTHPVKSKKPNELGLYDMSGNVWEWCKDEYGDYSGDPQVNPRIDSEDQGGGRLRVCRGGGWGYDAKRCRVADRLYDARDRRGNYLGFRLVLFPSLPQEEEKKA